MSSHQADLMTEGVLRAAGQERLLAQAASVQGSLDAKPRPAAPTTAPTAPITPSRVPQRQPGARPAVVTTAYMLASSDRVSTPDEVEPREGPMHGSVAVDSWVPFPHRRAELWRADTADESNCHCMTAYVGSLDDDENLRDQTIRKCRARVERSFAHRNNMYRRSVVATRPTKSKISGSHWLAR
jgi:hypothetical protein